MSRIFTTVLCVALTFFTLSAFALEINQDIPAVETWEEMAVPYPPADNLQEKILIKWYKDPRGNKFEGSTFYYKSGKGEPILIMKTWDFKDTSGDGTYRDWSQVRVALFMEDGRWVVGDPGEMLSMEWGEKPDTVTKEVGSLTLRFLDGHSEYSRTVVW